MKKFVISEEQEKHLAELLNEETYQMPVPEKTNKPYCINPEKVNIVKKFLDGGFKRGNMEIIGDNGLPKQVRIVAMCGSNGDVLKNMYLDQMKDLMIDKFKNMFSDHVERDLFMNQVLNDWFDNKISVHGMLSVNCLKENKLNEITTQEVTDEANEADRNPSEAQKEAGNYKMGHVSVKGMRISIENPKGSYRKYKNEDGTPGYNLMHHHYGYFNVTKGKDGDAVDCFLGPDIENFEKVYAIDQNNKEGEFDETKVMLGFSSKEEAKEAYMSNYSADWKGFRSITCVPLKTFKKWLYRGRKQRQPFADYVMIQKKKINESKLLKEEEYNEIHMITKMDSPEEAEYFVEVLQDKGIDAYADGRAIYAMVEQDRMNPSYVDDVVEHCKKMAMKFQKMKMYDYAVNESDRHRPGYYAEYTKKRKENGESADRHRPGYYDEYRKKKKEAEKPDELHNPEHMKKKKKKSGDRHKPGYYHKYNQEHPERLERGFTKGYIDGKVSNGPKLKVNGNIWFDKLGRPHSYDPYNPTLSDLLDAKEQEWHDDDWEESTWDD